MGLMGRVTVHGMDWNVADQGTGQTLLLVHGFPLDHQMWQGQMGELSEDFRVIAPDLRGFGTSDGSPGTVTMDQFADDLAELLDTLGVTEKTVLCGLSMGGYIAWEFWRRHAHRLAGLILCDTRAAADAPPAAQARLELAEQVLEQGSSVLSTAMIPKLFSEQTRRQRAWLVTFIEEMIRRCPPQAAAAALRGMARRADARDWLPRIDLPTLVICGREDALSTVSEMQDMAAAMPQAELAVIPGCGHLAPLEDPVHVNKAMRRFLGRPKS
jgi:3-oxoadipate enol-lactonase